MTTTVKSQQEFYDQYKNEVLGLANELTDFSEGSLHDIIAGALSICQNELTELIINEFVKTFFNLASGPTAEDPRDYIEELAVDHFGDAFSRPDASFATGIADFSRANTNNGDVTIGIGTIVKTEKDANGEEIRFETTESGTMTGLTLSLAIKAVNPGIIGNITSNDKIIVIETTLTDPTVVVTNSSSTAGGEDAPDDDQYREIIKNKIVALAGATEAAVQGAALAVAGVDFAKLTTLERVVIDYDIANDQILPGSTFFRIPYPILYIADANGNSSQSLIDAVEAALVFVKACGVRIDVRGAVPVNFDWTASVTLNAGGPNYSVLQSDLSMILDSMTEYINTVLDIGEGFVKANANSYIMGIWGPSGTNDISAFSSSVPSGNVSIAANEKLIANNIGIV